MNALIAVSVLLMMLFVFSKNRTFGVFSWVIFSLSWISKVPYYLHVEDYFNTVLLITAFVLFNLLGFTIAKTDKIDVFVELTSISALASLAYFPFAFSETLRRMIIEMVVRHTVFVGNLLGFPLSYSGNLIVMNNKAVEIILACTGIESMALFFGVCLSVKAELKRNLEALVVSVPTIYFLNLLRNVFVSVSYFYSWFGENSFYIAHHVISKVLATIALILISLTVFKIIPELLDLLYKAKDEIAKCLR